MRHVIIGAGEQVKNVLALFKLDVAFIFDEPREQGERKCGISVFNFNPFEKEELSWIAPIRDTRHKRELVREAMRCEATIRNLTHPTAIIADNVCRGLGIYTQPLAVLYSGAKIGCHTTILGRATVGHDVEVGDYCTLGHHSFLGGHVTLDEGVEIGAGAVVLQDTYISEGATIGAGAVVLEGQLVPPNEIWVGVPAKPVKARPMGGTYHPSMFGHKTREPWR